MSDNIKNILLIGSGYMATEYAKVLNGMKKEYTIVGRGEKSAAALKEETGHDVVTGGIEKYLGDGNQVPEYAIVALPVESLSDTTLLLIKSGVKNILIEKPGALKISALEEIQKQAEEKNVHVYIGYNRRFYKSVSEAKKMIQEDGGAITAHFEFTEWTHRVEASGNTENTLKNWFLGNSSHVVDLAFYLCGMPKSINCEIAGQENIPWHPVGSIYSGSGVTENNVLFSYDANWGFPGRWALQVNTKKHRFILKPLEQLKVVEMNSVKIEDCDLDYSIDTDYKAGLYKETEAFLTGEGAETLCTAAEQIEAMKIYEKISGETY